MPNYSKFEEYLNTQNDSVNLKFSEIESIVGKLPKSAFTYQEWWSNHPSHPLMKVVLKNGWKQRNLDLFLKKVEFSQHKEISIKNNQKHIQKNTTMISKHPKKLSNKIESSVHDLKINNLFFSHVCKIIPQLDTSQNILEFFPQERYENKNNLKLNKYGVGPFCKFTINRKYSNKTGVYILTVGDDIRYVGECDDFYKRYGMGYGTISPRNCFEGGQPTNCRINSNILLSIKSNNSVNLYFLQTEDRFKIEHELIQSQNPSWNKTLGKPSKIN
jgi:hypothetical protein